MTEINNLDIYTERMRTTLAQKAWFMEKIPETVETIIDFGGADGSLGKFICDTIRPMNYFVYDNNEDMRKGFQKNFIGTHNYNRFYTDLDDLFQIAFNWERTVIVFSSVCHEIYNYSGEDEFKSILDFIDYFNPKYMAFRDMSLYLEGDLNLRQAELIKEKVEESAIYKDYKIRTVDKQSSVADFLMKYTYTENWARESTEYYFWPWVDELLSRYGDKVSIDRYRLQYQMDKIDADWGITIPWKTHANALVVNK